MKSWRVASLLLSTAMLPAQSAAPPKEQSMFDVQADEPRIQHPVPLPAPVLETLQTDEAVKSCLQYNPLDAGQSLRSWFIASTIHLAGPQELDLVVVPSFQGEESPCFESASGIGRFWIFRKIADERYELAMTTLANGIRILPLRTNGFRNIEGETISQAGGYITTTTFDFNGTRYVLTRERTTENH